MEKCPSRKQTRENLLSSKIDLRIRPESFRLCMTLEKNLLEFQTIKQQQALLPAADTFI
jgi:hypothetical protein